MMKFELARKYLVGFLALAVLTMSFALPLSAPAAAADLNAGPIVDASIYAVSVTPLQETNTASDGATHTVTILTTVGGIPTDVATGTVWAAVSFGGSWTASGLATVKTASPGIYTFTGTYGSGQTFTSTGVWSIVAYITTTGTGVGSADIISAPVTKTWDTGAYTLIATPATKTNVVDTPSVLYTHTITLSFRDQLGGTPIPSATTTATWAVTPTSHWGILTGTVTWDGTNSTTTATYGVTPTHGTFSQGVTSVTDIITITGSIAGTKTSTTVTKIWSYTQSLTKLVLDPATATNQIGTPHYFTAYFYDQYDWKMPLTGVLYWKVTGSNTKAEATVPVGAVDHVDLSYTGDATGLDTISATLSFGTANFTASAAKLWVTQSATNVKLSHSGTTNLTATNTVGYPHELTATVTDIANAPVVGATVIFTVIGAHPTATHTDTTGATGTATWSNWIEYTAGTDTIVAYVGTATSNAVTKIWEGVLPAEHIVLTQVNPVNSLGETHQVMALVTDELDQPMNGVTVDFKLLGRPTPTGTEVTGSNGVATWSYTATAVRIDQIQASVNAGTLTSNVLTKNWVWGTVTKIVLSPATAVNTPSTQHPMEALVTNEFDVPKPDVLVTFSVTPTGSVNPFTATGLTDVDGIADFTFTSTKAQVTTIVASAEGVNSNTATKTWAAPTYVVTATPSTATNTINTSTGSTSHTITVTVKDLFDADVTTGITVNAAIGSGPGTVSPTWDNDSEYVFTLTVLNTVDTPATTVINFTVTDTYGTSVVVGTAVKNWRRDTGTPSYIQLSQVGGNTSYNYIGTTHTIYIALKDQYGGTYTGTAVTGTLYIKYGTPVTTITVPLSISGTVAYGYHSDDVREDTITFTPSGNYVVSGGPLYKIWVGQPGVGPDNAVNVLGATHNFVITGVPGETVVVTFSSAGIFDLHNLTLSGISPAGFVINPTLVLPTPVALISNISVLLDGTGTATVSVMSQAPGKFYMDTYFGPNAALGRTSTIMIKVSKAYAKLHQLVITPTSEINPITQVSTWDVHTVTVVVGGEFPVTRDTTVPGGLPPEGGTYVIKGENELWAINVPIANADVNWQVQWTDQTVNRVYVSGYDLPSAATGFKYAPGTAPFWFTAFSTTDAKGEASLTYKLDWAGVGAPTVGTCTWYFPCINETITASAGYGNAHLDLQYKTQSASVTKEWRDHAFKLIKYNGHIPIGSNDYIEGAKFFLRRVDLGQSLLSTSPTYVPPMPAGLGWTTPPFAPVVGLPGNAALVIPSDPAGVVTTATYGEAIWLHLPYGVYGLYEYSTPVPYTVWPGELFRFTINADAPYWCGPDPKITTWYQPNTISPTGPEFYKLTWCGTKMTGVTFQITNLDSLQTVSYLTGVNGRLQIILSNFIPSFDATDGTWYKVHEVTNAILLDEWNAIAVPDFYFNISANGAWNGNYYDYPDIDDGNPVWGLTQLPWAFDMTFRHWVVDPQKQALTISTVTLVPLSGSLLAPNTQILTVTVRNLFLQPMPNQVVLLSTSFGTLNTPIVITGISGTATFSVTGATAGTATINATSNGVPAIPAVITFTSSVPPVTPLAITSLTVAGADPTKDVAYYNILNISAIANKSATWTGFVYKADGTVVATLPTLVGTTYSPTWMPDPLLRTYLTGAGNYVKVWATDGTLTPSAVSNLFTIYNFPLKFTGAIVFYNSTMTATIDPLTGIHAGTPFWVAVTVKNLFTSTFSNIIVPVTISMVPVGIGSLGGLLPGTESPVYAPLTLNTLGTYQLVFLAWDKILAPTTLAPSPLPVTIVVNP